MPRAARRRLGVGNDGRDGGGTVKPDQLAQLMKWARAEALAAYTGEYYGEGTDEHALAIAIEDVERIRLYEVFGFMAGPDREPSLPDSGQGHGPALKPANDPSGETRAG